MSGQGWPFNSSPWEVQEDRSQGQPGLRGELQAISDYTETHSQKTKNNQTNFKNN